MVDVRQKHFVASFRYNKKKPKDFGFQNMEGENYCTDKKGGKWTEAYLWDNGWGNEYGFIRQPEPDFDDLWTLLIESKIDENKRGAAELINEKYPEELINKLTKFLKSEPKINRNLSNRLDLLQLGINRSEVIGKHITEIEQDFEGWSFLKAEYERLKK